MTKLKKTSLAIIIAASTCANFASAMTIENDAGKATIYGKIGVGYESYKEQSEAERSGIVSTRNSEVGLNGNIASNGPIDITFDIRASYKASGGFIMDRINASFNTDMGDFLIGRSDSPFDTLTRDFDKFDGQFSEEFEVGDSIRDKDRIIYSTTLDNGVYLTGELSAGDAHAEIGSLYSVGAKLEVLDGLDAALAYESNETPKYKANELNVTTQTKVGMNYNFANAGLKSLDVGLIVNYKDDPLKEEEFLTTSLSGSYKYDDKITLLAGLATEKLYSSTDPALTVTSRIGMDYQYSKDVRGYIGFAHNDRSNSKEGKNDFMHTVGLIYSF